MEIIYRREMPPDYEAAEELTRDAFWNIYKPGCDEHYILHIMRSDPAFVPELTYVAQRGHELVGHIAYTHAKIVRDDAITADVLCFGPISVRPALQGQGIGGALIRRTQKLAREMGYGAIVIYGSPAYYSRFGFEAAEKFGILGPGGKPISALQVCALTAGALRGVSGIFEEAALFDAPADAVEKFDRRFFPREKGTPKYRI